MASVAQWVAVVERVSGGVVGWVVGGEVCEKAVGGCSRRVGTGGGQV